jgi:hypothetical protein
MILKNWGVYLTIIIFLYTLIIITKKIYLDLFKKNNTNVQKNLKLKNEEKSGYFFYRTNSILSLIIIAVFIINTIYSVYKMFTGNISLSVLVIGILFITIIILFGTFVSPYISYRASSNFYKNNLNKSIISNILVILSCLFWIFLLLLILGSLNSKNGMMGDNMPIIQMLISPVSLIINIPLLIISRKNVSEE